MIHKKTLFTSLSIFASVYLILVLPIFGAAEKYANFYREQAFYWFNNFGDKGFVVFTGHEDNGQDDTRVEQANKSLVDAKGNVTALPYNISTRILGYLPVALLIALFAATPIKLWKRAALLVAGFLTLHACIMFFLYIIILNKFITTPWLKLYQDLGKNFKGIIEYLNASINHGMGLNNFLVVIIWLSSIFIFERNMLEAFFKANDKK